MYSRTYVILLLLLLAGANFAAHGHALNDGLFLDDHWHALRLAENDWSISALYNATTIVPDRFMGMWWQEEAVSWWYIRPFAVFVAKTVYHFSGGSVKALHLVSILLHLAGALMVHHLVFRMTRKRFWAILAALLFVVHSHSVYAVAWLAAQNALLQTTLMLAGLLLYIRASGLDIYAGPGRSTRSNFDGAAGAWSGAGQACDGVGQASSLSIGTARCGPTELAEFRSYTASHLAKWPLLGFFVCWFLALLSRESAVMLPFFVAAFDLAFGGWMHVRRRLPWYVVMGAIATAFLLWRVVFFDHPMPDFYVQRPDRPGYALWWLAKLLHYFTATVWLSPMTVGPSGRFNPWSEVPGDCVLMVVILAIMGIGYHMSCRHIRGQWIWPTWILLGLLPVVAIVATPHNGYLPSVGFAIGMAIGPALRHETRPTSVGRWCTGVAIWFLIATTTYMPIYRPMWYSMLAAERMTIDQVMQAPPGPQVTDVFFINLPFVNIYACYHLDEALGRGPVLGVEQQAEPTYRTHALTYAADVLRAEAPCRIEQLDAHRFRVSTDGDRPWFSGALGRFLIEGLRPGHGRFRPGDVVSTELADVTILRADADGVRELEFAFDQPLASERFCFYVGTPGCAAARVRFVGPEAFASEATAVESEPPDLTPDAIAAAADRLRAGEPDAAVVLLAAADPDEAIRAGLDPNTRTEARRVIAEVCEPVAEALAAPVIERTPSGLVAWADWRQSARWWGRHVDGTTLAFLSRCKRDDASMRWQRDALFRIRGIASHVIRTDLYLTGPPFPGPR